MLIRSVIDPRRLQQEAIRRIEQAWEDVDIGKIASEVGVGEPCKQNAQCQNEGHNNSQTYTPHSDATSARTSFRGAAAASALDNIDAVMRHARILQRK